MRYLKPYKLFESTEVDFDIEQDIKDIFLELEDIGFTIKIGNRRFSGGYEIEIMKINDDSQKEDFLLREICDSLIVLVSYLKDNGYYIYDVLGKEMVVSEEYHSPSDNYDYTIKLEKIK